MYARHPAVAIVDVIRASTSGYITNPALVEVLLIEAMASWALRRGVCTSLPSLLSSSKVCLNGLHHAVHGLAGRR